MASAETAKDEQTFPCRICTRRFIKSSLDKHEQACKKLTKIQRKVFDSGKQRALNSDIPINDVRKVQKEREKMGGVFPRPQTNWRERHEEFIGAVSASKQVGNALKTGAPLPPPPKTASNADYIKCDFCGRSFNKNAAERHIEFCKEQNVRKAILSKQGRQKTSESVKSRPKTRSSLTSSSATSSGSSHYGQSDKAVLTNSKSTHAPIQSSYPNQRRPSGGSAIIHRNTESVERINASSNTRLPQPTTK
uniref:C2HC/C3H-type domain-containing protein n=1 Tax=Meloidogyne enterolobii TaxID=390850 RepID=A0A6V7TJI0_MELEN|nr:unnamed protein product [Meloidogyne enterolobii]